MDDLTAGLNIQTAISLAKHEMTELRCASLTILSSIQYLTCEGLAVRGHTDEVSNLNLEGAV